MNNSSRLGFLYRLGLIVPSVVALIAFLFVALSRVTYPFALEWLEAGTYTHVVRVLEGKPLYAAPSYEFITLIYTPLYFYIAAPWAWLMRNVMLSARLVSIASSLVAFVALYGICRSRRLPRFLSLLAVGFMAASYKVTGYWFDLGRVDMLFLAFVLVAFLLMASRAKHEVLLGVTAGIVMTMAFATKQQAAVAYPFLVLYPLADRGWKKALAFGWSAALGGILFVWAFNTTSGGWFWFYVFTLPGSEPASAAWLADIWRIFLAPACWPLVALAFFGVLVALAGSCRRQNAPRLISLALLVLPLLAMSSLSLAKQWGYVNGFLPAAAGLALAGAEAVFYVMDSAPRAAWVKASLLAVALALVWLQFGVSRYDPRDQIPSDANVAAGYQVLEKMRRAPTPIFAPTAPYLLHMIGQPMQFQATTLSDITLAAKTNPKVKEILTRYQADIYEPFRRGRVAAAVLPETSWYDQAFSEENGYTCERLTADGQTLTTMTGAKHALGRLCTLR